MNFLLPPICFTPFFVNYWQQSFLCFLLKTKISFSILLICTSFEMDKSLKETPLYLKILYGLTYDKLINCLWRNFQHRHIYIFYWFTRTSLINSTIIRCTLIVLSTVFLIHSYSHGSTFEVSNHLALVERC